MEGRKLLHDPTEMLTRAVQPALWLLVFGAGLHPHARDPDRKSELHRFHGARHPLAERPLHRDILRDIGDLGARTSASCTKFLVSPTPRSALVLGKALSAGIRGLTRQSSCTSSPSFSASRWTGTPLSLLLVALVVLLGAGFFSTFSLVIACLVKTRERFMGIGQILTMPLFFASNAIYPISIMPRWLQVVSRFNPLTYQVDALRGLMISGGSSAYGAGLDILVLTLAMAALVAVAAKLYPTLAV